MGTRRSRGAWIALLQLSTCAAAFGQLATAINPAQTSDPRTVTANPATVALIPAHTYLGLKLIYPGVVESNTFALKSTRFIVAVPALLQQEVGAALHGQFFTTPLYSETRLGVIAAAKLRERMSFGLDLALQNRHYRVENFEGVDLSDPVFRNGEGLTVFDPGAGACYRLSEQLTFGAAVLHFTRPNLALGSTRFRQPVEAAVGASITHRFARLDVAAHRWQSRWRPLLGAEFSANQVGRVRLGFALSNALLEGQLVLRRSASLFYAFHLPTGDLGLVTAGAHEVGLVYEFQTPNASREEADREEVTLAAIPDLFTVQPGEAATSRLRLHAARERQQDLKLRLLGAPPGVTLRQHQVRVSTRDDALISIAIDSSLPEGTYDFILAGESKRRRHELGLHLIVISSPGPFVRLTATVDTVTIAETREIHEELPLIPRVFFAANATQLAESRYDLLTGEQSADYFPNVREINAAYRQLLSIIADRLRTRPEAVVTIRGFSPGRPLENQPEEVALGRAQYVRNYLVSTLQVPAGQLRIEVGEPDPQEATSRDPLRLEELQRVDLVVASGDEETLLAPIMTEKKEIDAIPGRCGFVARDLGEGAGLHQWALALLAGADTVGVLRGGAHLPDTIWWNWQSDPQHQTHFWQEVRYSLELADRQGRRYRTPWQRIHSRYTHTATQQIEKIPIILFAFDDYQLDQTSRRLRAKLRQIAAKLLAEPSATAMLFGHTDEIGEEEHNAQLSVRRAHNVYQELVRLGVVPQRLSFVGFGETQPLANNRLPEGRMLNRRVEVHLRHGSGGTTR